MAKVYDLLGQELRVGDTVVYGKSDRNNPLAIGIILDITDKFVEVKGVNNIKSGHIPIFNAVKRMVKLSGEIV